MKHCDEIVITGSGPNARDRHASLLHNQRLPLWAEQVRAANHLKVIKMFHNNGYSLYVAMVTHCSITMGNH